MGYYTNDGCLLCGDHCLEYSLCYDCYCKMKLRCDKIDIEKEKRFYNEEKIYKRKKSISTKKEKIFYEIAERILDKSRYVIIPQISLQAIIDVENNNKRNDELFRNIDFGIFYKQDLQLIMLVEINDNKHYTNEYTMQRDKSVKAILKETNIPLLTLTNDELIFLENKKIEEIILKALEYSEQSLIYELDILNITTENIDNLE